MDHDVGHRQTAIKPPDEVHKQAVIMTRVQEKQPLVNERDQQKSPDSKENTPLPLINTERGMMDLDALFQRLVIVIAVSDNHAKEVMGMIASAQRYMPRTQIYLYNLGLENKTYTMVMSLLYVGSTTNLH